MTFPNFFVVDTPKSQTKNSPTGAHFVNPFIRLFAYNIYMIDFDKLCIGAKLWPNKDRSKRHTDKEMYGLYNRRKIAIAIGNKNKMGMKEDDIYL